MSGGFQDPFYTPWCILAIRAAQENVTADAWTIDGKNPFTYMNGLNHPAVAASGTVSNIPSYYSKTILAYVAAGKRDRIYSAGVPPVDLLAKLYEYRHPDGHFSLAVSNPDAAAVNTTIWAILAMHAAGVTGDRVDMAVAWLRDQALDNGGFPSEAGRPADVDDTAAAIQALLAGGVAADAAVIENALSFLRRRSAPTAASPTSSPTATPTPSRLPGRSRPSRPSGRIPPRGPRATTTPSRPSRRSSRCPVPGTSSTAAARWRRRC